MNYTKPTLVVLGDASTVIRGKASGDVDGTTPHTPNSAYELDEE
jgi:hypothetical protein